MFLFCPETFINKIVYKSLIDHRYNKYPGLTQSSKTLSASTVLLTPLTHHDVPTTYTQINDKLSGDRGPPLQTALVLVQSEVPCSCVQLVHDVRVLF